MEDTERFEQVAQRIAPGGRLLRAWPLTGGVSAQVTGLEIAGPDGRAQKLVMRRHGAADLAANPRIAADEFRLLQIVRAAGVAAPEPCLLDESNTIFATPYLVMEFVEGAPEFAPAERGSYIAQLAAQLAGIHKVDGARPELAFLPRQAERYAALARRQPARPDESFEERQARAVLASACPPPQHNQPALLHGDYWPGNILWNGGRLAAVIDWEDAAVGDPLADLANIRLELLWAFGAEAMQDFTRQYLAAHPLDLAALGYWELYAGLRPAGAFADWAPDEQTRTRMRERHAWFVAQALARLDG